MDCKDDSLRKFLEASPRERLEMLGDEATAIVVSSYLGQPAFNELQKLRKRTRSHLAINVPPNLIFVPGVMGSLLMSRTKGGVWWIDVRTRNHIDDLKLSDDGTADADKTNDVTPFAVDTTYEPFATAVLARDDFGHSNFAYDWRKSVFANAVELRDAILRAHGSINLGDASGRKRVHVIAHSMGGLVTRAALMDFGKVLWPVVGRIVFIGTPHYGSPAIAGYLKNHLWGFNEMAILGLYLKRETFRSLWGVLQLLPAPKGIYPGTRTADNPRWRAAASEDWFYEHPCANFDMYDAEAWDLGLDSGQRNRLQTVLDAANNFHTRLHNWHDTLSADQRERMLIIAGVGYKTLFRLEYKSRALGLWESMNKITDRVKGDPHREGDGRVPLASATLEKVSMRFVKGVHGGLTNIPEVYSGVFDWLNGQPLNLPDSVNKALAGHLAPGSGSEAPHLDGTARTVQDDPGYWDLPMPDPPLLEELNNALDTTGMAAFHRVRLL